MIKKSSSVWVGLLALLVAASCGKSEEKTGEADKGGESGSAAGAATDKPTGEGTTGPAATPAKVDEALMAELKKIAEVCEINVRNASVRKCPDKEDKALTDKLRDGDRGAALDTFTAALTSDDDKLKTVGANLANSALGSFGDGAKIEADAARRYIAAVAKLEKYHAAQAVHSAVHAAMLAKVDKDLYAMLDGHKYAPVRPLGYKSVMTHGRLRPLDKLKALAKEKDEKIASAALEAPRKMYKPTAEEKAAVCPWIKGYLGSSTQALYTQAGYTSVWCGGEYVDALLDEGEKRLAANDFNRDSYLVFRDICFTPIGNKVTGNTEQCDRNYKFLEAAVNNDKLEGSARGLALFAIYYQRRDAATMKLVKKYKNSKVPEIKKYANDAIKSLQETYKIK